MNIKLTKLSKTLITFTIGILIAAITFTEIGTSIYGIIKNKNNLKYKIEKQLNLCSTIISLSLTQ